MGNVFSSRAQPTAAGDTQPMLTSGSNPQHGSASPVPLFLGEIEPTPAAWSQESKCVVVQRFLGLLPDSEAEKLKQEQKASLYTPRVVVLDVSHATTRGQAIVAVQRVYRRYRLLRKWHLVSFKVLEIARTMLREREAQEEEAELLENFREILASGFSAQKVSINGALKSIQLQLVVRPADEECYLTWTPSRKRQPRIHLHDVQEVVPVLKEGNKHAPRLADKVSHRRGLIIVCKSHHRGRVVLQMGSKRERKVLLLGFQRLLEDLNRFEPTLDATGAIRKRMPRRQSAIQFFENDPKRRGSVIDRGIDNDDGESEELREETPVEEALSAQPVSPPAKVTRRQSTSIARFYETRFDESPEPKPAPVARRSSVVV